MPRAVCGCAGRRGSEEARKARQRTMHTYSGPMMHTVQQALARGTGVRLQKLGTGHRSASRPAGTGRHRALR